MHRAYQTVLHLCENDTIYKHSEAIFHRSFILLLLHFCGCMLVENLLYEYNFNWTTIEVFRREENQTKMWAAQCSIANGTEIAGNRFKEFGASSVSVSCMCNMLILSRYLRAHTYVWIGHFIKICRLSFALMLKITYLPSHEYDVKQKKNVAKKRRQILEMGQQHR